MCGGEGHRGGGDTEHAQRRAAELACGLWLVCTFVWWLVLWVVAADAVALAGWRAGGLVNGGRGASATAKELRSSVRALASPSRLAPRVGLYIHSAESAPPVAWSGLRRRRLSRLRRGGGGRGRVPPPPHPESCVSGVLYIPTFLIDHSQNFIFTHCTMTTRNSE